jgi:hypothetical protein
MNKQPKHMIPIKVMIALIPIIMIIYLLNINFLVDQEFNHNYNIGGEQDYLTPLNRISEKYDNQRDLIDSLVYLNVQIPKNSETIKIQTKLKLSEYENQRVSLGAKDREDWHYQYHLLTYPNLDLTNYNNLENIYTKLPTVSNEELKTKKDIIIATDQDLKQIPNIIEDYQEKQTTIPATLRGKHEFYFYTENQIELQIKKQDLNWYEGEDPLTITIYDINNKEIINTTIEDDGIININKNQATIQESTLNIDLSKGIYKLEFSNFDGLIKEIKININKIITKRLFLADNEVYIQNTKETKIYTESKNLKFLTYHNEGLQNIIYNNKEFKIKNTQEEQILELQKPTILTIPENDLIVEATSYLAFSEENYFNPFTQTITSLDNYEQADYILTDYKQPIQDGEWIITETTFNIEDLYLEDNKLSLVFHTPHLSKEEYKNYTIPIDYINITIYKPGLI